MKREKLIKHSFTGVTGFIGGNLVNELVNAIEGIEIIKKILKKIEN